MTNTYDVAVIGSGLGGLIAGAKLAKEGKKVVLIEQHSIPGGCATTFKRKGYTIEVGLHELDGLHKEDNKWGIFDDLGVFDNIGFVTTDDFYRVKGRNFNFVMPSNMEAAIAELTARYPHDAKGIRRYFNVISAIRKELTLFQKSTLPTWLKMALSPFMIPHVARYNRANLGSFLKKCFKTNEDLRLIILANLQYYHDNPDSMSLLFYSAAQMNYYAGGCHFIQGGSQKLSDYLASQIEKQGGTIFYNHEVTRIIVEEGKVQGVLMTPVKSRLQEILVEAPIVVANAAIPTIPGLLKESVATELTQSIGHLEPACSILTLYVCMKASTSTLGNRWYSSIFYDDSCTTMGQMYHNATADFKQRNYVLVDYSLLDSKLNPADKPVASVCMIDYLHEWDSLSEEAYKARKEDLALSLIDRLEKEFPGFKENIVYYEVGTARTVKRYTLNPAGTPYGYAQTPSQALTKRIKHRSSIPGLYYASAWTMPGGGFTGSMIGGWLSASAILEDAASCPSQTTKEKRHQSPQWKRCVP